MKDENTNSLQKKNNKREKPKRPYLVQQTETRTIPHEIPKEYGCLNMVPNQRQQ